MLKLLTPLAVVVIALTPACPAQEIGDLALCCTCLAQKSPQNNTDSVDPSTNCLPDDGEEDQCNAEAAQIINGGGTTLTVTDENCGIETCLEECAAAGRAGADFVVDEESLSG